MIPTARLAELLDSTKDNGASHVAPCEFDHNEIPRLTHGELRALLTLAQRVEQALAHHVRSRISDRMANILRGHA